MAWGVPAFRRLPSSLDVSLLPHTGGDALLCNPLYTDASGCQGKVKLKL